MSPAQIESLGETVQVDLRQDVELRRRYAVGALRLMVAQVAVANVVFIVYAVVQGFDVPPMVMAAWLASTVVQVVGVTLAVTRGLFGR